MSTAGGRIFRLPVLTGLLFPSNQSPGSGPDGDAVRFTLSGANCPALYPLTLIWRLRPVQQTSYYTTFFWANQDADFINNVVHYGYFGCHPFPNPSPNGTVHNWEIAIEANDYVTDDNGNNTTVVKDGTWYQQAAICTRVGNEQHVVFYWNLSVNSNRVITYETTTQPDFNTAPSPGLMFADPIWNPADECLSGTLRGIQVFQSALTLSQINALRVCESDASALNVATSQSLSHWYLNINPTPSDVTDKSGNGRNPSWANANRPTLVTL